MSAAIFGTPVVEIINGQPMEFPKLFMKDFARLAEIQKSENKDVIRKSMRDNLITSENGKNMLVAVETDKIDIYAIRNSAWNPIGARRILEESWKKTGKPMSELDALRDSEDPELLCHIAFRCVTRSEEKKEVDPLAPKEKAETV